MDPHADAALSDVTARRYFEEGRTLRPGVVLAYAAFVRYIARQPTLGREEHAPDMYLACACAEGVTAALAEVEGLLTGVVARAVGSVDASPDFVAEVLQTTRERLLVSKNGEPAKIGSYAGRASLKSWLCAVAFRSAADHQRRGADGGPRRSIGCDVEPLAAEDPEFEYLRHRYKGAFESAVRTAIEGLTPKERMLLRLNVVEAMSIDRIGAMYKVGRSTAARWLASARRQVLEQARRTLRADLGLSATELESLVRVMRSHIEVSVLSLLGSRETP